MLFHNRSIRLVCLVIYKVKLCIYRRCFFPNDACQQKTPWKSEGMFVFDHKNLIFRCPMAGYLFCICILTRNPSVRENLLWDMIYMVVGPIKPRWTWIDIWVAPNVHCRVCHGSVAVYLNHNPQYYLIEYAHKNTSATNLTNSGKWISCIHRNQFKRNNIFSTKKRIPSTPR